MRAMLVTNHKGGVGKTFVSVHLAKVLSETGDRVLLVDCDGQYDSFKFFARYKKEDDPWIGCEITQSLTLVGNKECKSLKSLDYDEGNYDYIVLDGDARMADTVKNILQNEIKLVIVPVNFQAKAVENTEDIFETVAKLNLLDDHFLEPVRKGDEMSKKREIAKSVASQLLVVPLAADENRLNDFLKRFQVKTKVKIHKNMPWMLDETNQSLIEGVLIWEIQALSAERRSVVKRYFEELATKVKRFFN